MMPGSEHSMTRLAMPNKRLTLFLVSAVLLLIASLVLYSWRSTGANNLRTFAEQTVFFQGEQLRLPDELAGPGPVRVVHFWDPECPCYKETDAHLNYLIGMYRFSDVEFYSLRKPGTSGELPGFLQGKLKELDYLEGADSLPASPAIAIWDHNGKLTYAGPYSEGLICNSSNSFVEPILDALVYDKRSISATNMLAVGCYCPWSTAQ